jgi:hypothetical protein
MASSSRICRLQPREEKQISLETLSENAGIAKGEDRFDLDKGGGWVYKFPFEISNRPM